ncbi:hypothetical protein CFC21_059451, partial [Triticum aestivum]
VSHRLGHARVPPR